MASIDDNNPIIILDTPRCLSEFILRHNLNKQDEYDKGGLARYAECILEVARMMIDQYDPDDGPFIENVSERIDTACEYIGAFKDEKRLAYENMARGDYFRNMIRNEIANLKNEVSHGKLTPNEILTRQNSIKERDRIVESDPKMRGDGNYYMEAIQVSMKLVEAFMEYCLKYNIKNAKTYIAHLNDYQMTIEIYRL